MKFLEAIDVCAGAGGWAIAARGLPIRIVEAFDLAQDCLDTYAYNNAGVKVTVGDIRALDWKRFRGIDIVLGGIPCEEISPARRGMFKKVSPIVLEHWHELLDSVLAGIDVIQPPFWALENVIQMRRHLPPLLPQWDVNARDFCGQNRRRLFIGKFPVPKREGDSRVLSDYLRPGPFVLPRHVLNVTFRPQGKHLGFAQHVGRILNPRMKSPTVIKHTKRLQDVVLEIGNGRKRVMQFTEAAALQGFPDDYVFVSTPDRAWKMVAQAIPIPVGRAILKEMK